MTEPLKDGDWGADIFRDPALDQALAERDRLAEVAEELAVALRNAPPPVDDLPLSKSALASYEALKEEAKAQAPKPHEQ